MVLRDSNDLCCNSEGLRSAKEFGSISISHLEYNIKIKGEDQVWFLYTLELEKNIYFYSFHIKKYY